MNGLLLSDELMFTSRITATARAAGISITVCRDSPTLLLQAAKNPPACVLLDLNNPGLDVTSLVKSLKVSAHSIIVAYGSHVGAETLKIAREAGCDLVLPRSKFVESLESQLLEWCKPSGD